MAHKSEVRERVMDALMDIIAGQGLDRVTIREVASVAAVSIGTVQYYCRSKEEMLELAFEHVIHTALARVDAIPRAGNVGAVMRGAMQEFMPLDERRERETRIYLAFATRSLVTPNLSAIQHRVMARLRGLCADAYRLAQQRGQTLTDVDADVFGIATVALLDGLNLHLLSDPEGLKPAAAVAIAEQHLARYFQTADSGDVKPTSVTDR